MDVPLCPPAACPPGRRPHGPEAAGLASESKNGKLPYGRRFPAACCGELQFWLSQSINGRFFIPPQAGQVVSDKTRTTRYKYLLAIVHIHQWVNKSDTSLIAYPISE